MLSEAKCPKFNCPGKGKVYNYEITNDREWYFFLCKECGEDWQEDVPLIEENDEFKMQVEALLLGFEIFEAAYNCLDAIGFYNKEGKRCEQADQKCLKYLGELSSSLSKKANNWGPARMKKIFEHEDEMEWPVEDLAVFAKEAKGAPARKAEEIIRYIRAL